jgi:mono/diheme cytochrome c family protein
MSEPEIHTQQQRENPEPEEGTNPMPWFVILLTAVLFTFGVVYIVRTTMSNSPTWGDSRAVADLQGPAPAAAGSAVDGAAVFTARCAACHQASGQGLPGVFPPLAGSEWVAGEARTFTAIVLHGVRNSMTVSGKTYNGAMPAFKDQLQDAEIAAVLTHVRGAWGNQAGAVTADSVAQVRKDTEGQVEPYDGDAGLAALK